MNTLSQKSRIATLNKHLKPHYRRIVTTRGRDNKQRFGDHILMDSYRNVILNYGFDLDAFDLAEAVQ